MLGYLASGEQVVDRHRSHLHPEAQRMLPYALQKIKSTGLDFFIEEVEFPFIIGQKTCVATDSSDVVVYARRLRRFGLSRFVMNREAEDCRHMVVILKKVSSDMFILITAFVGRKAEKEPWDRNAELDKSLEFWNRHALIWGSEKTVPRTDTFECPW
ncbi:MAG: hypothetical protein HOG08_02450 [Candidatus Magasanikbacteria bacterium]|jgi:hypothetical protein|nr:hypothetical protein [Candidatus Magasanikbacteria bacterium]